MQFVGICMVWDGHLRRRPRWPLPLLLLVTAASGVALFGYALEKYHYTVDVLLAGYLTTASWMLVRWFVGIEVRKPPLLRNFCITTITLPRQARDKHRI
jgi:hypothetical protein|eukprot:COSAG06_NODE_836_length_12029_cov_5.450712_4_plen_99_part_00